MGEVFAGHYELIDLVGLGSMGAVWRAWDRRQQTYVAAKLLRQSDAPGLLKFIREESAALEGRSGHLLVPKAWAGADDQVLISTDLVRGGSVAALLVDHGPIAVPWVTALVDQVLDALDALHAATGLIHRAIRPAKLLLEPTGRERPYVWVTGFTAVEQGDPRDDLYDVGMLAAWLLTGLEPDPAAGVGPAPLDVPEELWSWVRRMAAADATERPASAAEARAGLDTTGTLLPDDAPWPTAEMGDTNVPDRLGALPADWGPEGPGAPGDREDPGRDPGQDSATSGYDAIPHLSRGDVSDAGADTGAPRSADPSPFEIPVLPDLSSGLELPTGLRLPQLPPDPATDPPGAPDLEPDVAADSAADLADPDPAADPDPGPDDLPERQPLSQRAWQVRQLGPMEPPSVDPPPLPESSDSELPPLDLEETEPFRWRRVLLWALLVVVILGGAAGAVYVFVLDRW